MKDNAKPLGKLRTVEQVSAGGAAFRRTASGYEIALISVAPSRRWQLPKGLIDPGETPEIAALREVREEAGIETELIELIEKIEYWYYGDYQGERERFHKTVYFYLLAYRGGTIEDHDAEVVEARFVGGGEAIAMLAFKSEQAVVEKALKMLSEHSPKMF